VKLSGNDLLSSIVPLLHPIPLGRDGARYGQSRGLKHQTHTLGARHQYHLAQQLFLIGTLYFNPERSMDKIVKLFL
jgi:hypothetical protein